MTLPDMLHIKASAMEGAVGRHCTQDFTDGLNPAFTRGFGALNHQRSGAHAHEQTVPAAVERNRRVFYRTRQWLRPRWPESQRQTTPSCGRW